MSPRKTILKELDKIHRDEGPTRYTRPNTLPGYGPQAGKYQEAVNGLLKDRLIDGKKDNEGHIAIALNPHRMTDVQRELRPWFARPVTWFAIVLMAGLITPFLL